MKKKHAKALVALALVVSLMGTALAGTFFAQENTGAGSSAGSSSSAAGSEGSNVPPSSEAPTGGSSSSEPETGTPPANSPLGPESGLLNDPPEGGEGQNDPPVPVPVNVFTLQEIEAAVNSNGESTLFPNFVLQPNSVDTALVPGGSMQLRFYMTNNADTSNAKRIYRDMQVRIYFDSNAQYIDFSQSFEFPYSYGSHFGKAQLKEETDGSKYILFDLPGDNRGAQADSFDFSLAFRKGATPDGTLMPLRAELWYKGEGSEYEKVTSVFSKNDEIEAKSSMVWSAKTTASPTMVSDLPVSGGAYAKDINFTVNVNKTSGNTYYPGGFHVEDTLVVPAGLTLDLGNVKLQLKRGNGVFQPVDALTPDVKNLSITENPDVAGEFHIAFDYVPTTDFLNPAEVADFSYRISASPLAVANGQKLDVTMTYTPTLKAWGIDPDDTKEYPMAATGASLNLKTEAVDETYDGALGTSLYFAKAFNAGKSSPGETHNGVQAFKHGDDVAFSFPQIAFGVDEQGDQIAHTPYVVENFRLADYKFDEEFVPQYFAPGQLTDVVNNVRVPVHPDGIELTFIKDGVTHTLNYRFVTADAGKPVSFLAGGEVAPGHLEVLLHAKTDDGKTAADLGLTNFDLTGMALLYDELTSELKVADDNAPLLMFKINSLKPQTSQHTIQNFARMSFDYQVPGQSKTYTYSKEDNASVQLKDNFIANIQLKKTHEKQTNVEEQEVLPGDVLRYTIVLSNDSPRRGDDQPQDRVLGNPTVKDIMPTNVLDLTTFKVLSVTAEGAGNPQLVLEETIPGDGYTSITENAPDNKHSTIEWKFTGNLEPGQKITIVYEINVKTAKELEEAGIDFESDKIEVVNRVVVWRDHEHGGEVGGGSEVIVNKPYAKPFITDYELKHNFGENVFDTGTEKDITYTVTARNIPNALDGSSNVDKLVLAGKLPDGFRFKTGGSEAQLAAELDALFTVQRTGRAVAGALDDSKINKSSGAITSVDLFYGGDAATYEYKIRVIYNAKLGRFDQFVLEFRENLTPTDPKEAEKDENNNCGVLRHNEGKGASELLTVTFKGTTPTDAYGFGGEAGYKNNFTATTHLYLWHHQKVSGTDTLVNLNANATRAGFRFKAAEGSSITPAYVSDTANLDGSAATKGALSVKTTVQGTFEKPLLGINKSIAGVEKFGGGTGSKDNLRPGDTITYRIALSNHSVSSVALKDMATVADILPFGQSLVPGSVKMYRKVETLLTAPDIALLNDVTADGNDHLRFTFKGEGGEVLAGTAGAAGKPVADVIYIEYKTVVNDDYMDSAAPWVGSMKGDINRAALLFTEEQAGKYGLYAGNKVTSIDTKPMNDEQKALWLQPNNGERYMHMVQVDMTYTRDRISPTVAKSLVNPPAIKKDGTPLTWSFKVTNRSAAGIGMENPYLVDVLPPGIVYDPGVAPAKIDGVAAVPTIIENVQYDFGGDLGVQKTTVLVWKYAETIGANGSITVTYGTRIQNLNTQDLMAAENYGRRTNTVYVVPGDAQQAAFVQNPADGAGNVPDWHTALSGYTVSSETLASVLAAKAGMDFAQTLGAGKKVQAMVATQYVDIWGDMLLDYHKSVRYGGRTLTSKDVLNPATLAVKPGEAFEYILTVNNGSRQDGAYKYSGLAMIDKFPFVGDKGVVLEKETRNSEFAPELDYTLVGPAGSEVKVPVITAKIVQYNSFGQPTGVVKELTADDYELHFMQGNFNGTLNAGDWMRDNTNPAATWAQPGDAAYDFDTIGGFRLVANDNVTLNSLQRLEVMVGMRMPTVISFPDMLDNMFTAWNTFACGVTITPDGAARGNRYVNMEAVRVGATVHDDQEGQITLQKTVTDYHGNPLPAEQLRGLAFHVEIVNDTTSQVVRTATLNQGNSFTETLTGLPFGHYTVRETIDGEGVPVGDRYDVSFVVNGTPNTTGKIFLNTYPAMQGTVEIINALKFGSIHLTKYEGAGNTSPMSGVKFWLLNKADNSIVKNGSTNVQGELSFTDLEYGTYLLVEQCVTNESDPDYYVPSGFTKAPGALGSLTPDAGKALYYKEVQLPAQNTNGKLYPISYIDVHNIPTGGGLGNFRLTKTWNGSASMPDGYVAFLLLPEGETDQNQGFWLGRSGNLFSLNGLAEGNYQLFEVTSKRYTPQGGWSLNNADYYLAGGSGPYNQYRYNSLVTIGVDETVTLSVNNTYPVTPPSSSSGTPGPSSDPSTITIIPFIPVEPDPDPDPDPDPSEIPSGPVSSESSSTGSGIGGESLSDAGTPFANFNRGAAWSLLNLICAITGFAIATVMSISFLIRRKNQQQEEEQPEDENAQYIEMEQEEETEEDPEAKRYKRGNFVFKLLTILAGFLTLLLFLILEDIRLPMTFITYWTPVIVPVFIVHLLLMAVYFITKRRADKMEEDEEDEAGPAPTAIP